MPLTNPLPDQALMHALRGGDESAFVTLYRRHHRAIYRFALLRSGSRDVAEDIVQEVFMGLIDGSLAFDPLRGNLQSFLFGVVCNLALKQGRSVARFVCINDDDDGAELSSLPDPGALPEETLLKHEAAEITRRALMALAPHYRDVLILYEIYDMSYVEIAQICHIDIGTVRSRLARGREKIQIRLGATAVTTKVRNTLTR